jgi:hypothetical protein
MFAAVTVLSTILLAAIAPTTGTTAPAHVGDSSTADHSTVVTANPTLQASLDRIGAQSHLWREAISSLRGTGRRIKIVTPEHVVVTDERGRPARFDRNVLAQVSPVVGNGSKIDLVVVVINLELLYRLYWTAAAVPTDLQADIDRVVIHEIYGHAIPYLVAGDMTGRCPDPLPNERPSDACSIRRENAVRAELRLGRRTDRGFDGLALTRRSLY